jgi:hypothetical protein
MFMIKTGTAPHHHLLANEFQDGVMESIAPNIQELDIMNTDTNIIRPSFEFKHFTHLKYLVVSAVSLPGSYWQRLNPFWTRPESLGSLTMSICGTRLERDGLFEFPVELSKDRKWLTGLRRVQLSTDVVIDETRFIYMSDFKSDLVHRFGVLFEAPPGRSPWCKNYKIQR